VYHADGVKMQPVNTDKVIRSEKGKTSLSLRASSFVSKTFLLTVWNDGVVLTKNANAT
jgi:hypothetical protein